MFFKCTVKIFSSLYNSIQFIFLIFYFCYRFADGLSTLGLLDMMKKYHSTFKTTFCSSDKPLKSTDLIVFQVELSPPGSNRWRLETKVEGFWRDFLLEIECKLMICWVKVFWFHLSYSEFCTILHITNVIDFITLLFYRWCVWDNTRSTAGVRLWSWENSSTWFFSTANAKFHSWGQYLSCKIKTSHQ